MKLYGTTTSPFVRRVRIVAHELGVPIELVNTATDEGMAQLRLVSPIRKVPVAVVELETPHVLYDSRAIIDWLTASRGWGDLAPPPQPFRDANLINAIDAALDAVIQLFYLRRDGVAIDGTPYAVRQLERADAIFKWLTSELAVDKKSFAGGLGIAEISLCCALDWMDFRKTYETGKLVELAALRSTHAERASLVATRPHA
jgi:glutathione S-transferase